MLVGYKQKATRKPVYLITTVFPGDYKVIQSRKSGIEALKPCLINEYNLNMGEVDSKDQSIYHLPAQEPIKNIGEKSSTILWTWPC